MHLSSILPIVVPRAYFALGDFPGYCVNLRHPDLCTTWVDVSSPDTITYVPKDAFANWHLQPQELHHLAIANLRKLGDVFTHERTEGDQCLWRAMMQADALGSSRLLLIEEIRKEFPGGELVGAPDRSCALVVNIQAGKAGIAAAEALVQRCYEGATTPMLPGLHPLELFEVDA